MKITVLGTGSLHEFLEKTLKANELQMCCHCFWLHAGTGELLCVDITLFGFRTWKSQAEADLEEPYVLVPRGSVPEGDLLQTALCAVLLHARLVVVPYWNCNICTQILSD